MYDVCVIGSGPGGYVAAIRAAQLGLKTVCVEKGSTLGGTCLNVGCIPSKALLQSSEYYALMRHDMEQHGIQCKDISLDFDKMMQREEATVKSLTQGVAGAFKKNKVERIEGTARFVSPHAVEVNGQQIEAKHFILATGSDPIALPFLPFDEEKVVSSTGALGLKRIPKKMIVIGAGAIGVELASVYNRLGTEVVIVEMLDKICPAMDDAVSKMLLQILKKQGLNFHLGAKVKSGKVAKEGVLLEVEIEGQLVKLDADICLVAVGRHPYTQNLGLDKIGVKVNSKGFVEVDQSFQTSVSGIYAIGDLIEGPMLAHKASEEGIAAAEIIAGRKARLNYLSIPNVIYTHPEVAAVGFTESEAKGLGFEVIIGICPFKANPRARCSGYTEGMVKVIGEKKTGRLLGMHIIGPHASELIAEGVAAIEKKMTLQEIAGMPHAHPTLSEATMEACQQALGTSIHL